MRFRHQGAISQQKRGKTRLFPELKCRNSPKPWLRIHITRTKDGEEGRKKTKKKSEKKDGIRIIRP
jgi:hypothetical protein